MNSTIYAAIMLSTKRGTQKVASNRNIITTLLLNTSTTKEAGMHKKRKGILTDVLRNNPVRIIFQ